jgi:pimeloyl-ACP methyl ester carboxylesterase
MTTGPFESGYAPVNGLDMYWESRGEGGTPLVLVHGGFGLTSVFGTLLDQWSVDRRVIAIELQGHGHTRDIERAFTFDGLGDDVGGLIDSLELGCVDLCGYSLGALVSFRTAIQHRDRLRRLVLVSMPVRRNGWFPEVLEGMSHVSSAGFDQMKGSPLYASWLAVAPDREGFPTLMDKTGDLMRGDYEWTQEAKALDIPTLLIYGDADSIPPSHAAEFFALLGGGLADAGWDGTLSTTSRLAILPGRTHYNILGAPDIAPIVQSFLA